MRVVSVCLVLVLSCFGSACTFYTSCPADSGNNPNPGGGAGGGGNMPGGGTGGNPIVPGPTPTGMWVNVTSNLAGLDSECGNLSYVSSKPDEDMLVAGIAQQGMWASTNGDDTWHRLGTGKGSEEIINRTGYIAFDPDDTNAFWEVGIYNPKGLYHTSDKGKTFQSVGDITHNDYVSIDFTDPDRKTLLVSEHEQAQKLLWSKDQGATWTQIGGNIPSDATVCSYPYVLDAHTFLLGCGVVLSGTGKSGVYKSTDTGKTWDSVSPEQGGASAPLLAADGTIYWATQFGGGMVKSSDQGDTWEQVVGPGVMGNFTPSELPDQRLAILSARKILISSDGGATWVVATTPLEFDPTGFFYSKFRKAFYVWHADCGTKVPSDGLMRYDFDYESE